MNTAAHEPEPTPSSSDAVLRLANVSLRFGDTTALNDVSLTVRAGESVALVGPSGAGKSSLISIANASVAPTTGSVDLLSQRPAELSRSERRALRARVGTVYQALHLPGPLRVIHNVSAGRLGGWSTMRAIRNLVKPTDVDEIREALDSLGIGDKLWQRTGDLSGGERQRVAIARLLVQHPDIVFADEPVASLDPARSREVIELLVAAVERGGDAGASAGLTESGPSRSLIVSLHAFDLAVEFFDRVVGLRDGKVLFDESASTLRADLGGVRSTELYELVTTAGDPQ